MNLFASDLLEQPGAREIPIIRAWSSQLKFLNFDAHEAPPVTLSLFAPSTIYQNVAHRLSRSRKKMGTIAERRILGSHQPQPGLMHQGSRLKRLAGRLLCHLSRC